MAGVSTSVSGAGKRVVVCGAGPVGALTALALGQRGFDVTVYESREDIRTQPNYTGRSINLALSVRGLEALAMVGLDKEWLETSVPMHARFIHNLDGSVAQQPYGPAGEAILSVSRRLMNERLIDEASKLPNVRFVHEAPVAYIDLRSATIRFRSAASLPDDVGADLIIGADGVNSRVREALGYGARFDYSQSFIEHGYKELSMPPVAGATGDARWCLPRNFLHIWPRDEFMLIALPNNDGSFTCTLFMPFVCGGHGFDELGSDDAAISAFMSSRFPDAIALMGPDWLATWHANAVGVLGTVRCGTYHRGARAVILGDAAHGMVPFYGQGMNAGFQDVTVLMRHIDQALARPADSPSANWTTGREQMLAAFSAEQVPAGQAMAQLALDNYHSMASHSASRMYRAQKTLENALYRWLGDRWIPQYTMVAFRTIPYNEVVRRDARQQVILARSVRGLVLTAGALAVWVTWKFAGDRLSNAAGTVIARARRAFQ